MNLRHVVVWIDHVQAHLIHFNAEAAENESVKLHATHSLHGQGDEIQQRALFHEKIAQAIAEVREILIVGPGMEKLALMKHLIKHHPTIADRVLSVETVDHPSDGQLLKHARKYFTKADLFL